MAYSWPYASYGSHTPSENYYPTTLYYPDAHYWQPAAHQTMTTYHNPLPFTALSSNHFEYQTQYYEPCQASSTPLKPPVEKTQASRTNRSRRPRSEAEAACEKRRTVRMNAGFEALRKCLPDIPDGTRVSKGRLLKMAAAYIRTLENVLAEDDERREQSSGSLCQSSDPSAISLPSSSIENINHDNYDPIFREVVDLQSHV